MKMLLRTISLVLCVSLLASLAGVSAAAAETGSRVSVQSCSSAQDAVELLLERDDDERDCGASGCGGSCGYCPAVVIPGIFQSKVRYLDDEGNDVLDPDGNIISAPLFLDIKGNLPEMLKILLFPLLAMLVTQRPCGFPKALAEAMGLLFDLNSTDSDGKPVHNIVAEDYPSSVATLSQAQKDHVYNAIHLKDFTAVAGEDHLYFTSLHSFGNNMEIAKQVYDLIQTAKRETGHDKVNLIPISLGGTIANSLFEYYPEVVNDLHRVVYIIPALDGSRIVGDVMAGNFNKENEQIYSELFPFLIDGDKGGYTGYLVNLLIRIVPKRILFDAIDETLYELRGRLLINSTCMWGLVPSGYYPELREELLTGSEHDVIREQTDKYYQAQLNSRKNIQRLVDSGVEVFDIVDYNRYLYPIVPSWDECNADGIIQVDSTSMGAYSIGVDTELPEDYVQANTSPNCADPTHKHISPDRLVDASTGLLPDRTFYFYNQHHEATGRNDIVMKLATAIILDDSIEDVYSDPAFPQFNVGRDGKSLMGAVAWAKSVDTSEFSPEDAAEFETAWREAERVLNDTVAPIAEFEAARRRLDNILTKVGLRGDDSPSLKDKALVYIFRMANEHVYKHFGPRGWSDPRRMIPVEN